MRYLLLILFLACNPVKQVLKDKNKLDKVAEVVVKSGYCSNDTTIITKTDTTYKFDTTYKYDTIVNISKDTQYVITQKVITRNIYIRDTIKNVVVDNARINVLQKEIMKLEAKQEVLESEVAEWKKIAKKRWWNFIWLIVLISIYVLRKPVIRFLQWHLTKT